MYKGKNINQTNRANYQKTIANLNAANINMKNRPDPYKMIQQFQKNKLNNIQSNARVNNGALNQINEHVSIPYQTNSHSISFQTNKRQVQKTFLRLEQTSEDSLQENSIFQIIASLRQKNKNTINIQNKPTLRNQENTQTFSNSISCSFWNDQKNKQSKFNLQTSHLTNYQYSQTNAQSSLSQFQFKKQIKSKIGKNDYQIKHKNQKVQIKKKQYKNCDLKECTLDQNLITMDSLEKTNGPTIKNYIQADNEQWQKYQSVSNFQLMKALKNFPHIKNFKNNQKSIINCALTQKDIFVCMPTGGGKSLTFQILTFIKKGIYVCILPLISLIFDQEIQAKQFGIQAFSLTAGTDVDKCKNIMSSLRNYSKGDKSILIFCTPQKIGLSQYFLQVLESLYQKGLLTRFIIDQVHCVSTWGKQFRKQYQNLSNIKLKFPKVPILALTATVTQNLKQEIIKRLNITRCYFFQSSFNRPNLFYQVRPKHKNILDQICKIIDQHRNQSGIIYCISKKQCQQVCQKLQSRGYKIQFYHANINEKERKKIQEDWMNNQINIIVATIAFGMGINKPDVKYVIHHSLSKSLENYYQQSGRAGRDGDLAKCILFYLQNDTNALKLLNYKNQFSTKEVKNFGNKQLTQMVKYCQEKFVCRRKLQLMYLGQKNFDQSLCQKTCDNCIKGKKFKYYQCIKHAKLVVKLVHFLDQSRQNITKKQLINICKGKQEKKKKIKIKNKEEILQAFNSWSSQNIDQLIIELINYQILIQKIVVSTFSARNVSNFYMQCNFKVANMFITKVQSLPLRRQFKEKKEQKDNNFQQQKKEQEIDQDEVNPEQSEDQDFTFLDQLIQQKKKKQNLMDIIDQICQEQIKPTDNSIKTQEQSSQTFKTNTSEMHYKNLGSKL